MDPPEFLVCPGPGLIKMAKCGANHLFFDFTDRATQAVRTSFYHAADRPGCDWNIKNSGQDLMCAL